MHRQEQADGLRQRIRCNDTQAHSGLWSGAWIGVVLHCVRCARTAAN